MFGDVLHKLNPDIAANMLDFNDRAWMAFFGLPEIFSSAVANARRRMTATMKEFVNLPEAERAGQAWGIRQILIGQEIVGLDDESKACMLLLIHWAYVSTSNTMVTSVLPWFAKPSQGQFKRVQYFYLAHCPPCIQRKPLPRGPPRDRVSLERWEVGHQAALRQCSYPRRRILRVFAVERGSYDESKGADTDNHWG